MPRWLRSTLNTADQTARYDLSFLRTQPKFVAAIGVFLLMPALVAVIYLSSLWDPASLTRNLVVLLVNEDAGADVQGTPVNLGRSLVDGLTRDTRFTFRQLAQPAMAMHEVDAGAAAFAVLIPPDFSLRAMEATQVGTARFTVHASEGNGTSGAGFAQRFAQEIAERVNQSINEQRFATMLRLAGGSKTSLEQLQQALAQLADGASQLAAGSRKAREAGSRLDTGLGQLDQGQGQLDQGLRMLDAGSRRLTEAMAGTHGAIGRMRTQLPPESVLQRLREGASQVAAGQQALLGPLAELERGATRLRDGHDELASQAAVMPFVGEALADGALKLRSGSEQLRQGLQGLGSAGRALSTGSAQLSTGVQQLTDGLGVLSEALAQLDGSLPLAAVLDSYAEGSTRASNNATRLAHGASELHGGSQELQRGLEKLDEASLKLRDGLALLRASLPAAPAPPDGTAEGLSESVKPALQFSAPVPNQGTALTPYFVPLSLWVGATLCAVLFAYHLLPAPLAGQGQLGIVLGKLTTPSAVVIVQALILAAVLVFWFNVRVAHPARFVTTLVLTALTFAALLFALVRLFGNAGRLLAVILLAVQLAASGTMVPIELTSPLFQSLHPWLPLSWSIRATRIAMFDAYEGAWLQSIASMVALLLGTLTVTAIAGRWRVVEPDEYRPMVE